jgi:hypothetical protein
MICNPNSTLNHTINKMVHHCTPGVVTGPVFGGMEPYQQLWTWMNQCDPCYRMHLTMMEECTIVDYCGLSNRQDCIQWHSDMRMNCWDWSFPTAGAGGVPMFVTYGEQFGSMYDMIANGGCDTLSDCTRIIGRDWPDNCANNAGPVPGNVCLPECRQLFEHMARDCTAEEGPDQSVLGAMDSWADSYRLVEAELATCGRFCVSIPMAVAQQINAQACDSATDDPEYVNVTSGEM